MKQYEVDIPNYFTLKHYREFNKFKDLDFLKQMVKTISLLTNIEEEEIREWGIDDVKKVYLQLDKLVNDVSPRFYALLEWNNKVWGYTPMSKMSLGEYIDLENLCKDTENNIEEIMAILYRPAEIDSLKALEWKIEGKFKIAKRKGDEELFNSYKVEKYDNETRKQRKEEFMDFPADIALGALSFFLEVETISLNNSQTYSPNSDKQKAKEMMEKSIQNSPLLNIMGGSTPFTNLETHQSYKLEESDILWI